MPPSPPKRAPHPLPRVLGLTAAAAILLGTTTRGADRFPFFEPVRPPRAVQVVAHRGAVSQAPANTRPALERCIEDGLEWAAVNVRLTRDGHHVLFDQDRLTGAGPPDRRVAEHTLTELRQVDLGSPFASRFAGERALSLEECFALARNRLNLCLDGQELNPEALAGAILAAGMERQVVVCAQPETLRRLDRATSGRVAGMARWQPLLDLEPWVTSNRLAAVEIDAPEVTPAVCRALHALGVRVQASHRAPWDTPESWDRSMDAGADWIRTELPEEVLARALWRRTTPRPVRFSLHRGASRYAPENTMPAFDKALRLGADFVEFDVRTSRDGRFYLLHDATLDDTTDAIGPIAARTSAELDRLSAGVRFSHAHAAVRLPTLEAFLGAFGERVDLYLDAKAIPPEALAATLERHGVVERTVIYQTPAYLARLKAINPRLRVLPPLGSPADLATLAATLKPFGVDVPWESLSKDLIDRCHDAGIQVFSDALGPHERVEDYLQAIEWGIDVIQTDHPLRLMRALERKTAGLPAR